MNNIWPTGSLIYDHVGALHSGIMIAMAIKACFVDFVSCRYTCVCIYPLHHTHDDMISCEMIIRGMLSCSPKVGSGCAKTHVSSNLAVWTFHVGSLHKGWLSCVIVNNIAMLEIGAPSNPGNRLVQESSQ